MYCFLYVSEVCSIGVVISFTLQKKEKKKAQKNVKINAEACN